MQRWLLFLGPDLKMKVSSFPSGKTVFALDGTAETLLTSGLNIVHSFVPQLCTLWATLDVGEK